MPMMYDDNFDVLPLREFFPHETRAKVTIELEDGSSITAHGSFRGQVRVDMRDDTAPYLKRVRLFDKDYPIKHARPYLPHRRTGTLDMPTLELDFERSDALTLTLPPQPEETHVNTKQLRQIFNDGAEFGYRNGPVMARDEGLRRYPIERRARVKRVDGWFYFVVDNELWMTHGTAPTDTKNPNGSGAITGRCSQHVQYDGDRLSASKASLHHLPIITDLLKNPTEEVAE